MALFAGVQVVWLNHCNHKSIAAFGDLELMFVAEACVVCTVSFGARDCWSKGARLNYAISVSPKTVMYKIILLSANRQLTTRTAYFVFVSVAITGLVPVFMQCYTCN